MLPTFPYAGRAFAYDPATPLDISLPLAPGLADALEERPRSGQPPKVTAALEAKIPSLACSEAPAGAARWTWSLLNETLVALAYEPAISDETIRKVLKKANSNPG